MRIEKEEQELDGLRLLALGRIPRCSECELYASLAAIHSGGLDRSVSLPAPPAGCTHQVCSPLAARMSRAFRRLAS
jgi:hypothetical protein